MGAAFEQCEAGMFFVEMIKRIKTTKIRWEQDTGILRQATDRRGGDLQKSSCRQEETETGIPGQETDRRGGDQKSSCRQEETETGIPGQETDRRGGDQKSSGRQDATETGAGNRKVVGIPEQETGKCWRYQRI